MSQLLTTNENNRYIIYNYVNQLFSLYIKNNSYQDKAERDKLFKLLDTFFKRNLLEVYYYFHTKKASSTSIAAQDLLISDQTIYRHVKTLYELGLLELGVKVQSSKKGGPRSVIYKIHEASQNDIARAVREEKLRSVPYYQNIQTVFEIYKVKPETWIKESELVQALREQPVYSKYSFGDVKNQLISLLQKSGKKVTLGV